MTAGFEVSGVHSDPNGLKVSPVVDFSLAVGLPLATDIGAGVRSLGYSGVMA